MTPPIFAATSASLSEFEKNPMGTVAAGGGFPVAILNHNEPAFYCVPARAYEAMQDSPALAGWVKAIEKRVSRVSCLKVGS